MKFINRLIYSIKTFKRRDYLIFGVGVLFLIFLYFVTTPTQRSEITRPERVEDTSTGMLDILTANEGASDDFPVATVVNEPELTAVKFDKNQSYDITVMKAPFAAHREEAENKFLEEMGISRAEACDLNITVGTIMSVDPDAAGQNYPLSFCDTHYLDEIEDYINSQAQN